MSGLQKQTELEKIIQYMRNDSIFLFCQDVVDVNYFIMSPIPH